MHGPAGVLTVVLYETALGGLALLWLAPLWGVVRPGFFKLAGATVLACAVLAWLAGRGELAAAGAPAAWPPSGSGCSPPPCSSGRCCCTPGCRRPAGPGWRGRARAGRRLATGRAERTARPRGLALLTGALFLGATMDGLLLGHWYLVDRRLSSRPSPPSPPGWSPGWRPP